MNEHLISQVPIFASLPPSEIEYLAKSLRIGEIAEQEILFRAGDLEPRFCVLLEGQVEIIKNLGTPEERSLGVRGEGAFLGEMSLFSQGGQHTATVRALTPLKLLEMTRADFDALLHRQPTLAYETVRLLSRRLEHSENVTIQELKEKNRQLTEAYQELQAAQAQIIEKERLEHELDIARHIQQSILPRALPRYPGMDFGALMVPARAVGGDFYDIIRLSGGRLGVVVGDVSDKGVPAALFMALTYSLVRAEASRTASPARALRKVNHHLLNMEVTDMFVTVLYGVLNCATRELKYARAGHPSPLILDAGGQRLAIGFETGQPLGLLETPALDEQSVTIPPGGTVLLFSDGLTEAEDVKNNPFGMERLEVALRENQSIAAQRICDRLWNVVTAFSKPLAPQDDIALLAIKCLGT